MASVVTFEPSARSHMHHKNLVQLVGLVLKGSTLKCIVMEVMGKVCNTILYCVFSKMHSGLQKLQLHAFLLTYMFCRNIFHVCVERKYCMLQKFEPYRIFLVFVDLFFSPPPLPSHSLFRARYRSISFPEVDRLCHKQSFLAFAGKFNPPPTTSL